MDVAAVDIAASDERRQGLFASSHMNLIALVGKAAEIREHAANAGEFAAGLPLYLLPMEHCIYRQKAEPSNFRDARCLHAIGVADRPAEHLVPAADAEDQRAARGFL